MKIRDSITLDASGLALTKDGFLVGTARVSRAGNVQQYLGAELGLTDGRKDQMFGVYRDPDVVFDEASMLSLAGRPVTRGHPPDGVTAKNWKDLAIGQMGGVIKRDGEHVVAPMAIMDHAAAKEVADGARALSAGYIVEIQAAVGVSPAGEPYQFRQAGDLRFNHVAYLPDNNPRAGNTRIGDAQWRGQFVEDEGDPDDAIQPEPKRSSPVTDKTRTVTVDSVSYEVSDQAAQLIERLTKAVADAATAATTSAAAHTAAIAAKDAELGAKDGEIEKLKADVVDGAKLDALVAERASVIGKARSIAKDAKFDGLSLADVKRAAVAAKLGDDKVKDKAEAYVDALFDHLTADVKVADPLREAITDSTINLDDAAKAANEARNAMIADLKGEKVAA